MILVYFEIDISQAITRELDAIDQVLKQMESQKVVEEIVAPVIRWKRTRKFGDSSAWGFLQNATGSCSQERYVRPKLTQKIVSVAQEKVETEPHKVRPKQTQKIIRDVPVPPSNGELVETELPTIQYKCVSKLGLRMIPASVAAAAAATFAKMHSAKV